MLDQAAQSALLRLARQAIAQVVGTSREPPVEISLEEPAAGAFVSLYVDEQLRGCIGQYCTGPTGLIEAVRRAAALAAHDTRFPPLSAAEFAALSLEISVLSELRPAGPEAIRLGEHGVRVSRGEAAGLLLPQVAPRNGWTINKTLAVACRKAGLPPQAWKTPDTIIEVFTAQVFSESDHRRDD
ncbi:MAG: AmmeMemoRadiSam system protein A [Deltaproteobacteria bacterium]|nr:AmmeMemoRadiSam system protein A [Deltaproteobacteria bacterium]